MADISSIHRYDGYSKLLNMGMGNERPISGDNRLYSNMTRYWHSRHGYNDNEYRYLNSGLASSIIDRPADDCFAQHFEVIGDDDKLMMDEVDRLSVSATFADAVRWARLFGASIIVMLTKDGGSWDEPLNLETLDSVQDLRIYDARHIRPTDRLYTDETSENYGKPEYYLLSPPGVNSFEIHETRFIPVGSDPLPGYAGNRNVVWWMGRPILDACSTNLDRLDQALKWTSKLIERKQQGIYSMEGLGELFAQDMDEVVSKRIGLVDAVRNNLSSVVVDTNDTYTVLNLGLDNLQNVIQEFQIAVCADSGVPAVMLFGKSTTGLNATGAGDLEMYYGAVARLQRKVALPALERLISVLWMQRELKSKIPDEWEIEFGPLWLPSEKEQADTKLVEAQAKGAETSMFLSLIDAGILMPEEVRKIIVNRYSEYGFDDAPSTTGGDTRYAVSVGGNDTGPGADDDPPPA